MSAAGPDLMGMLSQFGGGGPPMGGAPPEEAMQEQGGDPVSALRTVLDAIQAYFQVEKDEEDKKVATDMLRLAQSLLAKNQQDMDAAMGGSNARILRKAG